MSARRFQDHHYAKCCVTSCSAALLRERDHWHYRRWPARTPNFQRVHDVLLRYVKDPGKSALQAALRAARGVTLATWGDRKQRASSMSRAGDAARAHAEPTPGTPLGDVWEIGIVEPVARERTGYPHRSRSALRRLIEACSELAIACSTRTWAAARRSPSVINWDGRRWAGRELRRCKSPARPQSAGRPATRGARGARKAAGRDARSPAPERHTKSRLSSGRAAACGAQSLRKEARCDPPRARVVCNDRGDCPGALKQLRARRGRGAAIVLRVGSATVDAEEVARRLRSLPPYQLAAVGAQPRNPPKFVERVLAPELAAAQKRKTPAPRASRSSAIRCTTCSCSAGDALRDELSAQGVASDAKVREYYGRHRARFETSERIRIWRITVRDEKAAQAVLAEAQVRRAVKKWTELARERSEDKPRTCVTVTSASCAPTAGPTCPSCESIRCCLQPRRRCATASSCPAEFVKGIGGRSCGGAARCPRSDVSWIKKQIDSTALLRAQLDDRP